MTGVVMVGEPDSTTLVVPVDVVTPVPPLATGKAVPLYVIARVPLVVIGLPEIENTLGTVAATLVTVPDPVGDAHVPSPRQNVPAEADVPLFKLVTGKLPVTPVDNGKPVALVKTPDDGVPKAGVTKVGLVAKTNDPLPVSSETAANKLADVGVPRKVAMPLPRLVIPVPPFATGNVPVTPVVNGSPVALVRTAEDGVPNAGVTNVGLVENTKFVDVVPVAPEAEYPEILLNDAMPALVELVPPSAIETGAVIENAVPVSVNPVEAVYDPAPLNCDQGNAVVPSVPPAFAVHTQPVSALIVPVSIKVKALVNSAQVSASVVRVHAPAAQR